MKKNDRLIPFFLLTIGVGLIVLSLIWRKNHLAPVNSDPISVTQVTATPQDINLVRSKSIFPTVQEGQKTGAVSFRSLPAELTAILPDKRIDESFFQTTAGGFSGSFKLQGEMLSHYARVQTLALAAKDKWLDVKGRRINSFAQVEMKAAKFGSRILFNAETPESTAVQIMTFPLP